MEYSDSYIQTQHYYGRGIYMYMMGKYEEAIKYYNRALEIDPEHTRIINSKGDSLYLLQKYEEALECYNRALETDPAHIDSWGDKGTALTALKKYDGAINCFNRALEINPRDPGTWYKKGDSLSLQNKYEEALKCYDRAIDFDLKPISDKAEAWYKKGNIFAKQEKYEEALKCYDRYVEVFSFSTSKILLARARVFLSRKEYEKAETSLFQILKDHHNDAEALKLMGDLLKAQGETEKAEKWYTESSLTDWTKKGKEYEKKENYEEALKCYGRALEINSSYIEALNNKGQVYYIEKNYKKALEYFDRVIELSPLQTGPLYKKRDELRDKGERDKELYCYNKAYAIDCAACLSCNSKAGIMVAEGKLNEAEELYKKAMDLNLINALVWYNYGNLFALKGNYKAAINFYKQAIGFDDNLEAAKKKLKQLLNIENDY